MPCINSAAYGNSYAIRVTPLCRAHLLATLAEDEVPYRALVDVPGRQQAQRGVSQLRTQKVRQVGQLVHQVVVGEHHPLHCIGWYAERSNSNTTMYIPWPG